MPISWGCRESLNTTFIIINVIICIYTYYILLNYIIIKGSTQSLTYGMGSNPWLLFMGLFSLGDSLLAQLVESACNVGHPSSIPGSGTSPGKGNGSPLQYSCLENPMDGGAWRATVHGVTKSWTWLSDFTFSFWSHCSTCWQSEPSTGGYLLDQIYIQCIITVGNFYPYVYHNTEKKPNYLINYYMC